MIAIQVAFCFLVLFVAGLFVATFERLSHESTGFSSERLLTLDTFAQRAQPPAYWSQVTEHLRGVPGVETVALGSWALLGGNSVNSFISVNGAPPGQSEAYFLRVSPGWLDAMKIPFVDGRDFIPSDTAPGIAIVNETFAKVFFDGVNPVGRTLRVRKMKASVSPFESSAWSAMCAIATFVSRSCLWPLFPFKASAPMGHGSRKTGARLLCEPPAPIRSRLHRLSGGKCRALGPSFA